MSTVFHGLALTVALGLMAQIKPVVPKESFKWDVALVEPQQIQETVQAEVKPTQEPVKTTPRPVAPAPIKPQMVTQEVQTREVTPVVQREIRQVVETSQPIEETVAVQTITEAVTPASEQQPTEVLQTTEAVVESISASDSKPAESVAPELPPQVAVATRSTPQSKSIMAGWPNR